MRRVETELSVLSRLSHPNIVRLYDIIHTNKHIYILMEIAELGDLGTYIEENGPRGEEEAKKMFAQLLSAVTYLHSLGIAHRDIKPPNILISADHTLKLADFGLSAIYSPGSQLLTACGSPCYACPEIIQGKGYNPSMADVWSLGITLYYILFGILPFDQSSKDLLYAQILECKYSIPCTVSPQCTDILNSIFRVDPGERISLSSLSIHPWLSTVSIPSPVSVPVLPIPWVLSMASRISSIPIPVLSRMISYDERNGHTLVYHLCTHIPTRNIYPPSRSASAHRRVSTVLNNILANAPHPHRSNSIHRIHPFNNNNNDRIDYIEKMKNIHIRDNKDKHKPSTLPLSLLTTPQSIHPLVLSIPPVRVAVPSSPQPTIPIPVINTVFTALPPLPPSMRKIIRPHRG